jgi:hypothetical protein
MKQPVTLKLSAGLLILAGLFSAGYYWLRTSADPYWNAEHSRLRIEKRLDANGLQAWAASLLKQYSSQTNFGGYYRIDAPTPSGLNDIWMHRRPYVLLRDGAQGGERYVCLSWGSAMLGRWGLAIGSPDFVLRVGMESGEPPDMPPRLWKPGVYFYQHYH